MKNGACGTAVTDPPLQLVKPLGCLQLVYVSGCDGQTSGCLKADCAGELRVIPSSQYTYGRTLAGTVSFAARHHLIGTIQFT